MRLQITKLIILLIFVVSCNAPQKDHDEIGGEKKPTDQIIEMNKAWPIDTNKIARIVADEILHRLEGQQIRKSDFDEKGNFYVEFNKDTTNADPTDIVWEYYQIEKDEPITGNLNSDDRIDFAYRSILGATMGNMFGLEWHVYISDNDKYNRIENDFGGGKFSDMESVTSIDKRQLKTEFRQFDKEEVRLKDSVEFREYEIVENQLKRIR